MHDVLFTKPQNMGYLVKKATLLDIFKKLQGKH